ncbi:hypothetical protein MG290_07210 [Flavobacterium sp. CBA20B-1]|uniref:hypothetical protein n=1 Tax=unclassified Flavobacterium TaxID=196869 RepID=UPI002224B317|nr:MULTISPECIES: hypothetical protein [unclassified Flavobacterium]WCM43441.1 hypothetical protein MG290_07210 [Flavobacterium sp. CBA20B-1]
MFSCSNENEVSSQENIEKSTPARPAPIIENEIDEVFSEYFNSQEYFVAQEAIVLFNSKVSNSYAIKNSKSKVELFDWINNNISLTQFANIQEANDLWNNKERLQNLKFERFSSFLQTIKVSDVELLLVAFDKWEPLFKQTLDEPCSDKADDCRDAARATLIASVKGLSDDADQDEKNAIEDKYVQDQMNCKKEYDACINRK